MSSDQQFPFRYADAPRFHGTVVCSNIHDWRGPDHTFGVLESNAGYPRMKMERKPHEEYPKPGNWLSDRKVVGSYSSWSSDEDRKRAQEEDKADFRFRPATRQECAGKTFSYVRDENLKFAEDYPELAAYAPAANP
jgi:hypothetical protein